MLDLIKNNPKLTWLLIVLAACGTVASSPEMVAFLPDEIEGYVRGIAGIGAALSAIIGFSASPNKVIPKAKEIKEDEK